MLDWLPGASLKSLKQSKKGDKNRDRVDKFATLKHGYHINTFTMGAMLMFRYIHHLQRYKEQCRLMGEKDTVGKCL